MVGTNTSLHIQGINGAEILGFNDGGTEVAFRLGENVPIDWTNNTWLSSSLLMTDYPSANGEWDNPSLDKFIAFSLFLDSDYKYGWLRMDVINTIAPAFVTWGPEAYAYQPSGESIMTNEGSALSTDFLQLGDVKFISNNKDLKILNLEERAKYEIYSILGQKVKQGIAKKDSHIITLNNLNSGFYIIKLEGEETGRLRTKKILM